MSEGTSFRTVLRGYEPTEVDRAVADLSTTLEAHKNRAADLEGQLDQLKADADQAQQTASRPRPSCARPRRRTPRRSPSWPSAEAAVAEASGEPIEPAEASYEHLGVRIGQILGLARDEAADVRLRAATDAKAHREEVEAGAAAQRKDADTYAADVRSGVEAEAARMLEEARRQSDEILDTADRDATARREEAEAYYEHQRAAAAQAALDFEQTLAERRERAERDFTTQTAAAQAQLSQLQDSLASQRRDADRERASAQAESKRIVDEAQQQAEHLISEAQARVARIRSESERELAAASARRDSINAQLANVRQMLADPHRLVRCGRRLRRAGPAAGGTGGGGGRARRGRVARQPAGRRRRGRRRQRERGRSGHGARAQLKRRQDAAQRRHEQATAQAAAVQLQSAASSEQAQHPGVAQGVGFDPVQVQELRDPFVVRPEQLGVDVRLDRRPFDDRKAVGGKEVHLEGQAEDPRDTEVARLGEQRLQEHVTDPLPAVRPVGRQGADLGQVLPQHVQGAETDQDSAGFVIAPLGRRRPVRAPARRPGTAARTRSR